MVTGKIKVYVFKAGAKRRPYAREAFKLARVDKWQFVKRKRNRIVWSPNSYKSLIEMSRKTTKRKKKGSFTQLHWQPLYLTLMYLFPSFLTPSLYHTSSELLKCSHHWSPRCKPYPTTYTELPTCLNVNFPGKRGRGIWYKFNRYKHKTTLLSGT